MPAVQRREQFVDATIAMVARRGIEGATTRAIAEEADAPLAALHYCFPSKEALFFAVMERMSEQVEGILAEVPEGLGLGRAAGLLLRRVMAWYRDNEELAQAQLELFFWMAHAAGDTGRRSFELFSPVLATRLRRSMLPDDDESLVEPVVRLVSAQADGLLVRWVGFRDWEQACADTELAAEAIEQLCAARRRAVVSD
ncbi:TetR/AcrR family transcriptional regulator [Nocardioides sp. GY 10127]|uniref:TetR/AcrR family transcriptional regulator n=1 Tax=Nocardioides sp. GY 10127 TaxID=2569762 RepID=UPI0010A8FE71|nr:TetR/AcrR family transcriptional regulator [Nocardioides sp. GY 10127]TIC79124.1 TetR/AcrR family transcriptional regulator [Nocardioides sp. GY 10127]